MKTSNGAQPPQTLHWLAAAENFRSAHTSRCKEQIRRLRNDQLLPGKDPLVKRNSCVVNYEPQQLYNQKHSSEIVIFSRSVVSL